ncbi:MAG: FHA domain-containing protein [Woeseiaceae bacterium]|nr:FHA domain-containing protein [Woeseiaceae bacterium]
MESQFTESSRGKSVDQLQYDILQLHSKWLGLETEVGAREAQTEQLNIEIEALHDSVARKESLIKNRDRKIKALKLEIRQRNESFRQLALRHEDLERTRHPAPTPTQDSEPSASPDNRSHGLDDLQQRLERSEKYAYLLRQQSQDLIETNSRLEREVENLLQSSMDKSQKNAELKNESALLVATIEKLQAELDAIRDKHENDMRVLRFELGEAQDTVVQTDEMNNQLASDLVDARSFKEELERMLGATEVKSATRIKELQKEISKLNREAENLEQKVSTKSGAITILLAELAKKSEHIESIGEIDDVIHDIDERITERRSRNDEYDSRSSADRIARVLVGMVDGQVLQFPLFKERITIGRTTDNDIQIKAYHVSRRHAVIQRDGEYTRIVDGGSKNGVQVNSKIVLRQILVHGDVVIIGNARFRYEERKKRDA